MEEYVAVVAVQGEFAENQIRGFLEANGIATQSRGESLRRTHGIALDGLGHVDILVPRHQVESARELLARAERGELEIPAEDDRDTTA